MATTCCNRELVLNSTNHAHEQTVDMNLLEGHHILSQNVYDWFLVF